MFFSIFFLSSSLYLFLSSSSHNGYVCSSPRINKSTIVWFSCWTRFALSVTILCYFESILIKWVSEPCHLWAIYKKETAGLINVSFQIKLFKFVIILCSVLSNKFLFMSRIIKIKQLKESIFPSQNYASLLKLCKIDI